jgi:peptidylprolyl isomerase
MRASLHPRLLAAVVGLMLACAQAAAAAPAPKTMAEVLAAASAADWRVPDPESTLYVDLAGGRVVIELAPTFAPAHVAQIRALARAGWYDGIPIVRVQENYVVQWGDPAADTDARRDTGDIPRHIAAEFARPVRGLPTFTRLPDGDVYAREVGFVEGFPAARDRRRAKAWLAHCYGMVGAGRGDTADSGGGTELYVVIGHAPRHLDRNVTLVGRVLRGMELLTTLPRGSGPLGFHTDAAAHVPLARVRVAADLPPAERVPLEVLRTDTATFRDLVAARRERREPWFIEPTGRIELCNVPLPVRDVPSP